MATHTAMERHGVRGGPSVVLIHGLGLNRQVWQWMIPALSDQYDVIAYDLYGHGESAAPPETPSLKLFAAQLAEVMDQCDVDSAVIVGFSLGGMICRRSDEAQAAIRKRVVQAAEDGPAATVEAALERWFTDAFRATNPEMMEMVRGWVMANDKAIYPTVYAVLADGIDEITGVSLMVPALVLTGDEDYGNGPEMTHAIAADIAGGEALILPGLRHMALAEDPEAVNQPLRDFLDRVHR